jgi:hypothetical protein
MTILPIDPLVRVVSGIVWRCSIEERREIDATFHLDPYTRVMKILGIAGRVAQRDTTAREMLSAPGVLDGLKKMVNERMVVQQESAAAPEDGVGQKV